jgi:sugar/nucleoside kinase (ribokinase family)
MGSAVVAGHVCVDLIPELPATPVAGPGELAEVGPLTLAAGGCVANTGAGLAALGTTVRVVADAGDDELGHVLTHLLTARGTSPEQVRLLPGESTSYSIVVQPAGEDRSFWHHVGANAGFDGSAVDLAGADLLHVGYPSLLPALVADGAAALHALLARARAARVTTSLDLAVLDPGAAPAGWPAVLRALLPLVDVFSPSVDDVRTNLGIEADLATTARQLVELGPRVVLLTDGARGMQLATRDTERHLPARPVEVRTTLGAGDAATAGLLHGLLSGLAPEESAELAAATAAALVAGSG